MLGGPSQSDGVSVLKDPRGNVKVLISTPLTDYKLYAVPTFLESLEALEKPQGTRILFVAQTREPERYRVFEEHGEVVYWWLDGLPSSHGDLGAQGVDRVFPIVICRNQAILRARETGVDFLFYVDSDVVTPEDALMKLLRLDAPVASGVFFSRDARCPGIPYVFDHNQIPEDWQGIAQHFVRDIPWGHVIEAESVGAGCLLIRRDLFSRLLFRPNRIPEDPRWGAEDVYYCFDAQRLGFGKVKVDTSIECGHVSEDGRIWWRDRVQEIGEEEQG